MIPAPSQTDLGPFSADGASVTPWAVVADALRRSQKYYVTTVRPDGRPHVTPLLATPALTGLCFVTGAAEQKSHNLQSNPNCVLTTGSAGLLGLDLVVEGRAEWVTDRTARAQAAATFETNLGWNLTDPEGTWHGMGDMIRDRDDVLYCLRPQRAFAFGNGVPFSETRFRWS